MWNCETKFVCNQNLPLAHTCPEVKVKQFQIVHRYWSKIFLPRANSGFDPDLGLTNRLYCNFSLYFKTPISLVLWSILHDLRFRSNDAKSSTSIFVKIDHFIAGFSSPCFKMQPVTSCSTCREAILMRMSLLSAHVLLLLHACPFSTSEPTILLACGRNRELWEQPFQACAIDADAQWAG